MIRGAATILLALLPFAAAAQSISAKLVPSDLKIELAPSANAEQPRRPDMLPDGAFSFGDGAIREAWLTGPTTRYAHGVIGDAIEASGVAVRTARDDILSYSLGPDAVFEDRLARVVRIDGADAVLSVKSYLNRGAALALLEVDGNALGMAAESPPIGLAHRWLNPVGIADFDGDGRDEIAAILTPHIGGLLTLYRRDGTNLKQVQQQAGFSNHAIGTRELGWSAIVDANSDGIPDIVVPDARRTKLRIVTFAHGKFVELAQVPLPAALSASFGLAADPAGPIVVMKLADDVTYALTISRP